MNRRAFLSGVSAVAVIAAIPGMTAAAKTSGAWQAETYTVKLNWAVQKSVIRDIAGAGK